MSTLPSTSLQPSYGPFGSVPNGSDIVYFGETWYQRNANKLFLRLGAGLVIVSLIVIVAGGIIPGSILLLVAVSLILVGYINGRFGVHADLVCDSAGFTLRRTTKKKGPEPDVRVAWDAVVGTRCIVERIDTTDYSDKERARNKTYRDLQRFLIDTAGGETCEVRQEQLADLTGFIGLTNRSTQRLGYEWIPSKQAAGKVIYETVGAYSRVPV